MKQTAAFLALLGLLLASAAVAGQPDGFSAQLLDESQLAAYDGTGALEAVCAFGAGAGIPLAIASVVVSSLLLGIPALVLAIGGVICMVVL